MCFVLSGDWGKLSKTSLIETTAQYTTTPSSNAAKYPLVVWSWMEITGGFILSVSELHWDKHDISKRIWYTTILCVDLPRSLDRPSTGSLSDSLRRAQRGPYPEGNRGPFMERSWLFLCSWLTPKVSFQSKAWALLETKFTILTRWKQRWLGWRAFDTVGNPFFFFELKLASLMDCVAWHFAYSAHWGR